MLTQIQLAGLYVSSLEITNMQGMIWKCSMEQIQMRTIEIDLYIFFAGRNYKHLNHMVAFVESLFYRNRFNIFFQDAPWVVFLVHYFVEMV